MIDWFKEAKEFKKVASDKLSPTEFLELELVETPAESILPGNIAVHATEIPGIYKVQNCYHGDSELKYFMDGVQRTILWQYYNYDGFQIPLFLHFSGAVIIKRLSPSDFIPYDSLYKSAILVPSFIYEELDIEGIEDTGAERPWDLNEIKTKARIKSRSLRQELEQTLMHRFLMSSNEEILVKDGNIFGTMKSDGVIGIIKTHHTLYLQSSYPRIQQMVWHMPEFYRSMNFSIQLIENSGALSHKINSFYLRINEPIHPEMGLIRVEYNDSTLIPDKLSSWIIAERWIRANCERWDRQIYPIQVCENYLRTQIPKSSHLKVMIRSL
jgi:hypothetical protein